MFETALKASHLPDALKSKLIGKQRFTIFSGSTDPKLLVPAPFSKVQTVLEHERTVAEFAQLPDYGYSLGDWATGFATCPPVLGDDPIRCHEFTSHMGPLNSSHFPPQSRDFYSTYHELALRVATECAYVSHVLITQTRFQPFVDECVSLAFVLEAIGQHHLQDAWSMGHMWERWGSTNLSDFPGADKDERLARGLLVALSAGLIHGTHNLLPFPDAMCSPNEKVAFVLGGSKEPAIGDVYLGELQSNGVYAKQKQRLFDCSTKSIDHVYGALTETDLGASAEDCFEQRATNQSMRVGLGNLELDQLEVRGGSVLTPLSISSKLVRQTQDQLAALSVKLDKYYAESPDGVEAASGGAGPFFLGVGVNSAFPASESVLLSEETGEFWPVAFDESIEDDGSILQSTNDRRAAIPRVFHRALAGEWCEQMTLEDLYKLRDRAKGLPEDSAPVRVCSEFAARHLRIVRDVVPAQPGEPGCIPPIGSRGFNDPSVPVAESENEASLCSLLSSGVEIGFHVAAGAPTPALDKAALGWCTLPDCACSLDGPFTDTADGFSVNTDGTPGGDGILTKITLPRGFDGGGADMILAPDGHLWVSGNELLSVQPIQTRAIDGSGDQPNLTVALTSPFYALPECMAFGADGNLWYTQSATNDIRRLNPQCGQVTAFPVPTADSQPYGVAAGSDGNVWFTESATSKIGRITPEGTMTEFLLGGMVLTSIAPGIDGNLWFQLGSKAGTIDGSGIALRPVGDDNSFLQKYCRGIAIAPDGAVWTANIFSGVSRNNPVDGTTISFTRKDFSAVRAKNIVADADGSVWFTEFDRHLIGHASAAGQMTEYPIPVEAGAIAVGPDDNIWFTSPGALWRLRAQNVP